MWVWASMFVAFKIRFSEEQLVSTLLLLPVRVTLLLAGTTWVLVIQQHDVMYLLAYRLNKFHA